MLEYSDDAQNQRTRPRHTALIVNLLSFVNQDSIPGYESTRADPAHLVNIAQQDEQTVRGRSALIGYKGEFPFFPALWMVSGR
jgi:hypothetical protein